MKEKDYKRKMSTKFMSMKLDYVSCDFTLLNCFAVQNEKKKQEKIRQQQKCSIVLYHSELGSKCIWEWPYREYNYKQAAQTQYNFRQKRLFLYLFIHFSGLCKHIFCVCCFIRLICILSAGSMQSNCTFHFFFYSYFALTHKNS